MIIYGCSRGGVLVSFPDPIPLRYISIVELGLGTRLVVCGDFCWCAVTGNSVRVNLVLGTKFPREYGPTPGNLVRTATRGDLGVIWPSCRE